MSAPARIDHAAALDELADAMVALLLKRWTTAHQTRPPDEPTTDGETVAAATATVSEPSRG
jgi:hypothetical protein